MAEDKNDFLSSFKKLKDTEYLDTSSRKKFGKKVDLNLEHNSMDINFN